MPFLLAAGAGEALLAGAAVEGTEAVGVAALAEGATATGTAVGVGEATAGIGEALTAAQQAERLRKALALAQALANAAAQVCKTCCRRLIMISRAMSPESAKHIDEAQSKGYPSVLTYDPAGKDARRAASLRGIPSRGGEGLDRDEYPPAAFAENGGVADVKYIPSSDNQSSGGQLRAGLRGATPGCVVTIKTGP